MNLFYVDQDLEILKEYSEELRTQQIAIENLVIVIEQDSNDLEKIVGLQEILRTLWISSTKLELIPIQENLQVLIESIDFILRHKHYPPSFSDFLMLFMDRIVLISQEVLSNNSIDMVMAQSLHIALQDFHLAKTMEQFVESVPKAIAHIVNDSPRNGNSTDIMDDIDLFDDFESMDILIEEAIESSSATAHVEKKSRIESEGISLFIPKVSLDPIAKARDYMAHRALDPMYILAEMTDQLTHHGHKHTMHLQEMGLAVNYLLGEPVNQNELWMGIALHDIGLTSMSNRLNTTEPFTRDDVEQCRKHPVKGVLLAKRMGIKEEALNIIEQHHERIDGEGYPYGLDNNTICDGARIVAVVDAFHSMISYRPYKDNARKKIIDVISEIQSSSGTQFDSTVVSIFFRFLRDYWIPRHLVTQNTSTINFDN